ncbi:MAG: MopE-related protein, partial [Myxococcota bacterium]|nr:MopE-related protein [Myxococcota bacterium]
RNPGRADDCTTALGVDDDCDETVDEAVMMTPWYPDADGDGYGTGTAIVSCVAPAGHAPRSGDCDDALATRNPGRADDCTTTLGLDDDCDAMVDEGAVLATFYRDADGDGFGTASTSTIACSAPSGHVGDATDCDDTRAAVQPGATEVCNNLLDDDCDAALDCADPSCVAGCATIRIVSGNAQSAVLHGLAADPLIVQVENGVGAPLTGRSMVLQTTGVTSPTGLARLSDASGQASFTLRAAPRVGPETITVTSPGATDVTVTLTGIAPPDGHLFSLMNGVRDASDFRGFPGPPWTSSGRYNYGSIATTSTGRVYFVAYQRVLWIDPSGATGVTLGGGSSGIADGVLATAVSLPNSSGYRVAVDETRDIVYLATNAQCRVWAVDAMGIVTHVLGAGGCTDNGDGGLARDAGTAQIHGISVASSGALYVISGYLAGYRLRVIDTAGVIRTVLHSTSGTPALRLDGEIFSVAPIDGTDDVIVSGVCNTAAWTRRQCVLRADSAGNLTLLAGGGTDPTSEGIAATSAQLDNPVIAVAPTGEIIVSERWERIRRIATDGTIRTIVGTRSTPGDTGEGGPAIDALMNAPPYDAVYVAPWLGTHVVFFDHVNHAIRVVW